MAIVSRITRSGQLTLPAEIRRQLGLKPGDPVIWGVNDAGRAEIQPVSFSAKDLTGIFSAIPGTETSDGMERVIKEAFEDGVGDKISEYCDR